jgi:lipopolysaccharide transport system ATP-binding protein
MAAVIEFNNVSKRFYLAREQRKTVQENLIGLFRPRPQGDEFWALREVSFAVERGESLGLVGHNGAGKSTALKLMTRILEPTSGTVRLTGRVAALLELGSGFHPDLSGRENIFLFGSLMGFTRKAMEQRLPGIIAFAEIGEFIDTEIKHYSSGMYTRLAFAAATSVDPEILITDEVLAVGDEAFQRKCMDRIFQFRQMGKTIIFVSHALETVRMLCDQAVWLDRGQARLVGPANKVVDAYLADVNRQEAERLAEAHEESATAAEEVDPQRRGSREIEIERVELLGPDGIVGIGQTGRALTIRIHYRAHQPIENPVFGVGVYSEAGIWLSGPNTGFAEVNLPCVRGVGTVDYHIPNLTLLNGRYDIGVAVVDQAMLHTYDHHDRKYRLIVQSEGGERYGMLTLNGRWAWRGE